MRILHVSEAMGGGITSAVVAMVEATPEHDHHLLMRPRSAYDTGANLNEHFSSVHTLPNHTVAALRTLGRLNKELFPDIVHAHSSFGGVLIRVAGLHRARIVYSPHCFAFERGDISWLQRTAFRTVERILVPRTDLLLAVSPNEVELAIELGHQEVVYAPNRTMRMVDVEADYRTPLQIIAVGRVSHQKDWRYFLHLKRYVEQHFDIAATWHWFGGGDAEGERALASAGVEVTGWISRDDLLARMTTAQVYVHTAAWEAAPISILEAARLGLPLVLRSIPSLDSLELPGRERTVVGMAHRIDSLQNHDFWNDARQASHSLNGRHSKLMQSACLREAYGRVLGEDLDVNVPIPSADWEEFATHAIPSLEHAAARWDRPALAYLTSHDGGPAQ